jgi:Ca-activated chloride channel family protein
MVLDHPLALALFALLPLFALGFRLCFLRDKRRLRALGGGWRYQSLLDVFVFKSFFSFLFFGLFFSAALLALAGLRWGEHLVEERRVGQEVVILLDVSNSMLAADEKPSRLERSLLTVRAVMEGLRNARFAVVLFKGQAVTVVPLTEDRYALDTALSYASPAIMTSPGSSLEAGLEESLAAFSGTGSSYRAILLFTDGEYLSGNPLGPAARAGEQGIPILVAATGSEEGSRVLLPGGRTLLDGSGQPVVSRLALEPLRRIATLSGGEVYRLSGRVEEAAGRILEDLRGQREGEMILGMRREKTDRYRVLLLLALGFLSVHVLIKAVRWRDVL